MNQPQYNITPVEDSDGSQAHERFLVEIDGKTEEIVLHDYARVYSIPWLYDQVLELLGYHSPVAICTMLKKCLSQAGTSPSELRVFEPGAGSGVVGVHLRKMGIGHLTGLDIVEPARQAARREKPGLYDAYHIADLTQLPADIHQELRNQQFNCVVIASAAGIGHIPSRGLDTSFDLLVPDGWLVYHVRREAQDHPSHSEPCQWIDQILASSKLDLVARETHLHRYTTGKKPLHYEVTIGRRRATG